MGITPSPTSSNDAHDPDGIIQMRPEIQGGVEVWVPEALTSSTENVARRGGVAELHDPSTARTTVLPDTFYGTGDDELADIVRWIDLGEKGGKVPDLVVHPGGEIVPVPEDRGLDGGATKVPRDTFYAGPPVTATGGLTAADVKWIQQFDQTNKSRWKMVPLPPYGAKFDLDPAIDTRHGRTIEFGFLAFRSAHHSGRWLCTVLAPVMDRLTGHDHHIVDEDIGGSTIPILCRRREDLSFSTLAELYAAAGRWRVYHSVFALTGYKPFSR